MLNTTKYTTARGIFYNAEISDEHVIDKATRDAFYKVRQRHEKKLTSLRVFKIKRKNKKSFTLTRII